MRFNKPKTYGERGYTYRDITWFAWLPVTIDGETRWLENVTVKQVWTEVGERGSCYNKRYVFDWEHICFIN